MTRSAPQTVPLSYLSARRTPSPFSNFLTHVFYSYASTKQDDLNHSIEHTPHARPMNLNEIKTIAQEEIESLFGSADAETPKTLVMEPALDRLLFLSETMNKPFVSRHNIQRVIPLEKSTQLKADKGTSYFFFLRPAHVTGTILRRLLEELAQQKALRAETVCVCFIPFVTLGCAEILRHSPVKIFDSSAVRFVALDIDFLPVDDNLLTMEMTSSYHDQYISNDAASVKILARALLKLQSVFLGKFHNVTAHGKRSCAVLRLMQVMQHTFLSENRDDSFFFPRDDSASLDSILIVDRDLDPVSPLLSQRTYEGLIDAIFGVNLGQVSLPSELTDSKGVPYGTVSLWNHTDAIFDSLRHLSFPETGRFLNEIACQIQNEYNDRHEIEGVSDLRHFVQHLPVVQKKHRLSILHTSIFETLAKEMRHKGIHRHFDMETMIASDELDAETATAYLQECMYRRFPLLQVLRVICLLRHCTSCWDASLWGKIKDLLVESYGALEVISCLETLEESGLLHSDRMGVLWNEWKAQFTHEPTEDGVEVEAPPESIFCPSLITRAFEEYVLHTVLGEHTRRTFDVLTNEHCQVIAPDAGSHEKSKLRVFLLFFLGGVSLAEIEAIRAFERSFNETSDVKIRVIVAATNVMNGRTFVQSILGEGVG